jgi:uncharacterized caspase-like protein
MRNKKLRIRPALIVAANFELELSCTRCVLFDRNMSVKVIFSIWIFLAASLPLAEAHAAGRMALVIGNAAYGHAPQLRNSRNDADDISEQLQRLGFEVVDGRDLDSRGMHTALARFAKKLKGTEAALFYYSGHALQIEGQNYLVPIDAQIDADSVTAFELVKLNDVIEALGYTDGIRLLILDACRTNPFVQSVAQRNGARGGENTRGLARIERTQGMLIAYSTQPNATAADGVGRNSPFTAALVRQIQEEPGVEVGALFRHVAVNVNRDTGGQQTPELSVSLLGDFYLSAQDSDIEAWKKMGATADVATLREFISRFPSSSLVDAARARIETIENANERERLVGEYNEKERLLRLELDQAEAGFRKASEELAELRQRSELRQVEKEKRPGSIASTELPEGTSRRPSVLVGPMVLEREQQANAVEESERNRLATEVAAFEANKARLAEERASLQAERERAEKHLPVNALDAKMDPVQNRQHSAPNCQEINARAQLGDISKADRSALRQCH